MEFSWKKNLTKAGIVAAVASLSAASVVVEDALKRGELDLRKVGIGFGLAFTAGAFESLRNFIKTTIIR